MSVVCSMSVDYSKLSVYKIEILADYKLERSIGIENHGYSLSPKFL